MESRDVSNSKRRAKAKRRRKESSKQERRDDTKEGKEEALPEVHKTDTEKQEQNDHQNGGLMLKKSSINNDNQWTHDEELIVKNWGEIFKVYAHMNRDAYDMYTTCDTWLGWPQLVLNGVLASAGFAAFSANFDCDQQRVWIFVSSAIMIVAVALQLLYKRIKPGSRASTHNNACEQFTKKATEIENELGRDRSARQNGLEFERSVATFQDTMRDTLQAKAPIPRRIIERYKRLLANNSEIAKPELVDTEIRPIHIHQQPRSKHSTTHSLRPTASPSAPLNDIIVEPR
jgi:hypothetical protein